MSRIVFVTTEYDPVLPGGAGTVVSEMARRLADEGREVVVILVADEVDFPGDGIVQLRAVSPGQPDQEAPNPAMAASRAAALAVAELRPGDGDVIEFIDFWGLAYWTLTRRPQLGLQSARIGVRFHGPMHLIFEAVGRELSPYERHMEIDAYRLADFVVVPSRAMSELVMERYEIPPDRIVIGAPPVPDVGFADYSPGTTPEILYFGTISELKGAPDFLAAVVPILRRDPDTRAVLVGGDGWSISEGAFMTAILRDSIPPEVADRIEFRGRVGRSELVDALRSAWVVVLPSRFETFCLAAHEVRQLGLPIVVPQIPALTDFFSERTGAVIYDGTVEDLTSTLEDLLADPARLADLAVAAAPVVEDPLTPYLGRLPPPRHPRSQQGLAEKSIADLRVLEVPQEVTPSLKRRLASRALRLLPEPAARLAVRILPQRIKDRFRSVANWRVEAHRRTVEDRYEEIRSRRSEFPELQEPEVSVVIPCHNQGEFLPDAILSVFDQTFRSFEIVIIDDGSTDPATLDVLQTIQLPRTRIIRQENRGLPGARNAGMEVARGKYLVPLDADDELRPTFMERLHAAIECRPDAAYAHCWAELFGNTSLLYATRPWNPFWLTRANSVIGCVMMRREAWQAVGGYDETMVGFPEDWELWIRFYEEGWDQVLVPEPLFRYRRHGVTLRVLGEINYERGVEAIEQRHPALFSPQSLGKLRSEWYPLFTFVGDRNPLPKVAELVPAIEGLDNTWGKYVVDLRRTPEVRPDTLLFMAKILEQNEELAEVRTSSATPLVVLRRWNLHDPDAAPTGELVIDDPTPGSSDIHRGSMPRHGWVVPDQLRNAEIPFHRERPEEAWPVEEVVS